MRRLCLFALLALLALDARAACVATDGVCDVPGGEWCETCPADCGTCPATWTGCHATAAGCPFEILAYFSFKPVQDEARIKQLATIAADNGFTGLVLADSVSMAHYTTTTDPAGSAALLRIVADAEAKGLKVMVHAMSFGHGQYAIQPTAEGGDLAEGVPVKDSRFIVQSNGTLAHQPGSASWASMGASLTGEEPYTQYRMGFRTTTVAKCDAASPTPGASCSVDTDCRDGGHPSGKCLGWGGLIDFLCEDRDVQFANGTYRYLNFSRHKPPAVATNYQVWSTFSTASATNVRCFATITQPDKITVSNTSVTEVAPTNVVIRSGAPFAAYETDASWGNRVLLTEGVDYALTRPAWPASGIIQPTSIPSTLTRIPGGALETGDRVSVDYHATQVARNSVCLAMCPDDELVASYVPQSLDFALNTLTPNSPYLFQIHDEIRLGWRSPGEKACGASPGELLAKNVAYTISQSYLLKPGVDVLIYGDMFDPSHNAGNAKDYAMCEGNYYGSWEGLDRSAIAVPWYGGFMVSSMKHFADTGNRVLPQFPIDATGGQSIFRYYHDCNTERPGGCPPPVGAMYIDWYISVYAAHESYMPQWAAALRTRLAKCGNGQIDLLTTFTPAGSPQKTTYEGCDDGNRLNGDGCNSFCGVEFSSCGNATVEPPEQCDGGVGVQTCVALGFSGGGTLGCLSGCTWDTSACVNGCGNGTIEGSEECDDGNLLDGDGCESDCTIEELLCPNGSVDEGEECDDGNGLAGDGCSPDCEYEIAEAIGRLTAPADEATLSDPVVSFAWTAGTSVVSYWIRCGRTPVQNGSFYETTFDADVGNVLSYDVYMPLDGDPYFCRLYTWKKQCIGGADAGEDCQNVATCEGGTSCSPQWRWDDDVVLYTGDYCGDGAVAGSEECDDANTESGDGCSDACVVEFCGDATVNNVGEQCDDGGTTPGDGCNADCEIESCGDATVQAGLGETCDPPTCPGADDCCRSTCTSCGDGNRDAAEQCDDGNNEDSDGCAADCTLEETAPGTLIQTEQVGGGLISSILCPPGDVVATVFRGGLLTYKYSEDGRHEVRPLDRLPRALP